MAKRALLPMAMPSGDDEDDRVGYGRPPKHSRFRKGQSGNPYGRPKGARNKPKPSLLGIEAMFKREMSREIAVGDAGRGQTMPILQAAVRTHAMKAAKGDAQAFRLLLTSSQKIEDREKAERLYEFEAKLTYKRKAEDEIVRRKLAGEPEAEMWPHPADMIIDLEAGAIHVWGPQEPAEAETWELIDAHIRELVSAEARVHDIEQQCLASTQATPKSKLRQELLWAKRRLKLVRDTYVTLSAEFREHRLRRMNAPG